jgi:hypothetical protein
VDLGVNTGGFARRSSKSVSAVFDAEPLIDLTRELPPHPRLLVEPVAITGGECEVDFA